jgi:hypothetical protein
MPRLGFATRRTLDALTLGPRRRRRAMNRELARLDRIEFGVHPIRRRPRGPLTGVVVLLVAVVGGISAWQLSGSHLATSRNVRARVASRIPNTPGGTHIDSPHRLLPAVTAGLGRQAASYRLIHERVRWEPCRAIHYVVRHTNEGGRFDTLLRSAIADVSAASGLKFVDDGATSEVPPYDATTRAIYQPRVYGDRWAPVLISWSNASESPHLAGQVEGFAGPVAWGSANEPSRYVSGAVTYDVDKLHVLASQFGLSKVRTVLLHELGHLVGLDHTPDRRQVMYRSVERNSPSRFQPGDRAGLAAAGTGRCFTDY